MQIISHMLTKKGEKSIFFVVYSALEVGLLINWSGYLYICILIYMKTITQLYKLRTYLMLIVCSYKNTQRAT